VCIGFDNLLLNSSTLFTQVLCHRILLESYSLFYSDLNKKRGGIIVRTTWLFGNTIGLSKERYRVKRSNFPTPHRITCLYLDW
jgi:hypothetical protein